MSALIGDLCDTCSTTVSDDMVFDRRHGLPACRLSFSGVGCRRMKKHSGAAKTSQEQPRPYSLERVFGKAP